MKHPVDADASSATVHNPQTGNSVTIQLIKQQAGLKWETAAFDFHIAGQTKQDAQEARKARRLDAERRLVEKVKEKEKEGVIMKREQERDLVQRQIDVERAKRERIEALKESEKERAGQELQQWSESIQNGNPVEINEANKMEGRIDSAIFGDNDAVSGDDAIMSEFEDDDDIDIEAIRAKVKTQLDGKPMHTMKQQILKLTCTKIAERKETCPVPREAQDIKVQFTPRGFIPTNTARETEDEKWRMRIKISQEMHKLKQKQTSSLTQDGDETNPLVLKDKGNVFFGQGNYESAVEAYSEAIRLDSINANLFANRAASYLQLASSDSTKSSPALESCVADCSTGIGLLEREDELIKKEFGGVNTKDVFPEEQQEAKRKLRVKLLVRRGTARSLIARQSNKPGEMGRMAIADYQGALELDPRNEALQSDVQVLRDEFGIVESQ